MTDDDLTPFAGDDWESIPVDDDRWLVAPFVAMQRRAERAETALRARDVALATAREDRDAYKALYDDLHEATGCADGLAVGELRAALAADQTVLEAAWQVVNGALTGCREWVDEERDPHRCGEPAELVLWGKLLPPEALGPRCYAHAVRWLGHSVAERTEQYAVVDLRPLRAWLRLEASRREAAQSQGRHSPS